MNNSKKQIFAHKNNQLIWGVSLPGLKYFSGVAVVYSLYLCLNISFYQISDFIHANYAPSTYAKYAWDIRALITENIILQSLVIILILVGLKAYRITASDIGWETLRKNWTIPASLVFILIYRVVFEAAISLYNGGSWNLTFSASYLWSRLHNPMAYYWLLFVPVVSIFEELFFRGLLFTLLEKKISWQFTIIATALLFSASHTNGSSWNFDLNTFICGLIFGAMRKLDGSLWPSITAHLGNNIIANWFTITASTI